MKISFLAIAISAILFVACSNNQSHDHNQHHGTHQHEDGTIHEDHDEHPPAKQEEFTVADTLTKNADTDKGTHQDGHEHTH